MSLPGNESPDEDGRRPQRPFTWNASDLEDPIGQTQADYPLVPTTGLSSSPTESARKRLAGHGRYDPDLDQDSHVQVQRHRRLLPILAAVTTVVGSIGAGIFVWVAFDSIDPVSFDPLGDSLHWLALACVMLLLATAGAVMAIVTIARRNRALVGVAALVTALLVSPLAIVIGTEEGVNSVKDKAAIEVQQSSGTLVPYAVRFLEDHGVNVNGNSP